MKMVTWLPLFVASLPTALSRAEPFGVETKLIASDAAAEDLFGCSVAISGNTAIVGAFRDNDEGRKSGSAYLFTP